MTRYAAFLENELLPAARSDSKAGLLHVHGGRDLYEALLRRETTLNTSADELMQVGLEEVDRLRDALAAVSDREGHALLPWLRESPEMRFSTISEVLTAAERAVEKATAVAPDWFGLLPKAR